MGFLDSLGDTFYAFVFGLLAGFVLEVIAVFATIQLSKMTDRVKVVKDKQSVATVADVVVEKPATVPIKLPEKTVVVPNVVAPVVSVPSSSQFGQRFWYFVQGHEKPFPTLKEALSLFPVEYAKYGKDKRPLWTELPESIQNLIRREEIVRKK